VRECQFCRFLLPLVMNGYDETFEEYGKTGLVLNLINIFA